MSKYHLTETQLQEERILVLEAQQNIQAFGVLYKRYHEPVFRFVYQRCDSMDESKDVTSQVFIKAMESINSFSFRGVPFSSWLFRIALNEMNKLYKRNKLNRSINVNTEDLVDIGEVLELDEYSDYYEKLLELLPELDAESLGLVEMRFMEKRSFKEIGEILEITENNAKVRLYRVLDKLRAKMRQPLTQKS